MSFVPLHLHSEYSLLDGASQLPRLIEQVVAMGLPGLALTDHGVMYGALELVKLCKSKGITPIIGNEMYVINGDIRDKSRKYPKYHQVVLAKNTQGYKNLVKLTTISHLHGIQGKGIFSRPCINKEYLVQYKEGLIVTSGCLAGEVPQAILQRRPEIAREVAAWYQEQFGDDYYIEIQDHGYQEDRFVNVQLVRIARELGIPIILTNDSHFISCWDVEAHDALLCIQTGKSLTEKNRLRYTGTEYLKSPEEMRRLCRDHLEQEVIDEAIANTLKVLEKIEGYDLFGEMRMPDYPVPPGHSADSYLTELAWQGLAKRCGVAQPDQIPQNYQERLRFELNIIQQKGFSSYFLVVWDYVRYAREQGIPVGPGRGSAAGSLVAYALQITNIDPVKYGLLFERFLNPERQSMPDIDTDFCIERRGELIDYVTRKYGQERVAQIITFNRMTSKAILKDVGRVLDIPYSEADKMAKLIPVSRGKPAKLEEMIGEDTPAPEFKEKYEKDPTTHRWIELARLLEGTNKTFGVHAAGVVIAKDPLDEIVPLQYNNEGQIITQYSMEDIESLGLLKMDFLGLRNLTMIQRAVELIREHNGVNIDLDNLPLDDKKTYQLLEKGELEGIFQLESSGMKQVVRELKPSNLEDISSVLALYRPGPLDTGMIPDFIDRKHGRKPVTYAHELLKPILQDTYGAILYQEQIMRIAQDMAGYTLGQADLLRRAMGKKKVSEMEKHREQFVQGAAKRGVSQEVATELFDQMVAFAEYCFNKSHSTAYGLITFQTAYLKANYPTEYMAALLSSVGGDQDKVQRYITYCLSIGIQIQPPDINRSGMDFTPQGSSILFGLGAVKNVGEGAIQNILAARQADGPFTSLADFCQRVDLRIVNRRALEALICAGAFDCISGNRKQLIADLDPILSWAAQRAKSKAIGQASLFDLLGSSGSASNGFVEAPRGPATEDFPPQEKLRLERELLGFYVSDHPLRRIQEQARLLAPVNLADLGGCAADASVGVLALVTAIKNVTTKKGDRMAILQLEDLTGSCEAVIFPKTYERLRGCLEVDQRLWVWAKVDQRDEQVQLIVEDLQPIESVSWVTVEIPLDSAGTLEDRYRLQTLIARQRSETKEENRIPVVAAITAHPHTLWVRMGSQFWVNNAQAAVEALRQAGYTARSESLLSP
jgi:DNA polymerase-3 subunit alpha